MSISWWDGPKWDKNSKHKKSRFIGLGLRWGRITRLLSQEVPVMPGCLVNVQLDLTMLSRNKQTSILPCWIYGTCAAHINNNCQERVEVGIPRYLGLTIHTGTDKPQFENLLDFWKSPPFNVLSKTSVYVWMGSQSAGEKTAFLKTTTYVWMELQSWS